MRHDLRYAFVFSLIGCQGTGREPASFVSSPQAKTISSEKSDDNEDTNPTKKNSDINPDRIDEELEELPVLKLENRTRPILHLKVQGGYASNPDDFVRNYTLQHAKTLKKWEDSKQLSSSAGFRSKKPFHFFTLMNEDPSWGYFDPKRNPTKPPEDKGLVILGALPGNEQLEAAHQQAGLSKSMHVTSVIEDFEWTPFEWLYKTGDLFRKREKLMIFHPYDRNRFEHTQIPASDYRAVPIEKIEAGADDLYKTVILKKQHSYVHCKSGKGRSATVYAGYLMKYRGLSAEKAIAFIKSQRDSVSIQKTSKTHFLGEKDPFGQWFEHKPQIEAFERYLNLKQRNNP